MKRLLALLLLLFYPVFARADLTITVINDQATRNGYDPCKNCNP